jgi:hypothetical protein
MGLITARGVGRIETVGAGTLDAYPGVFIQTIKGKHNWEAGMLKDYQGFEQGWSGRNQHIIINMNFKLTAASFALAVANGAFLIEYSQVNLSGFDLPWINAAGVGGFYTGAWCYHEGGDIDLKNSENGEFNLSLKKFKDPTQNAQQFVIPS